MGIIILNLVFGEKFTYKDYKKVFLNLMLLLKLKTGIALDNSDNLA